MSSKGGQKSNLDDLMMAYTDLSKPNKSSGFRGPPVKDLKKNQARNSSSFQTSVKSRDWSTLDQSLEDAFSVGASRIPTQPVQPFIPQPQLLPQPQQPVFHSTQQTTRTTVLETDDWGDFQEFAAPTQVSVGNQFTVTVIVFFIFWCTFN